MGNDSGERRSAPGARPALTLVASQVIGQLALVAVIPVLTRIYPPAELGVYQIAFAIAFIALPVATLRMEYVVPTTHSPGLVRRRLRTALAVALGLGTAAALAGVVAAAAGAPDTARMLFMIALLLPALSIPLLDGAGLVRRGARRALAMRNLVGGLAGATLQAVFALAGGDVLLLPVALLGGRLIGVIASRLVSDAVTAAPAASTASAASDEPYTIGRAVPTIAAGALSSVTIQGLTVIAGATLGSAAAGQAGVAQRIASTPISLAGQALTQTTQLEFSHIIRDRRPDLSRSLVAHVRAFLAVGVVVGVALAIGGPLLAGPVLGEQWAPVGALIAMLAVPAALQVAVSPTDFLFVMLGRERTLLALQSARAVLTWTAGLTAAVVIGDLGAITLSFSLAWAAAYVGSLLFVFRAARRWDQKHRDARDGSDEHLDRQHRGAASAPVRPIFASMTGDYPNIGDAIIRRETLGWVRGLGTVHTYVGRAPDAWIEQIGARPLGPVYRRRAGSRRWIWALITAPRPVLLFEPGEVQLEARHWPRELVFLALTLIVAIKGGTTVFAPRAIVRPGTLTLWLYRQAARAAHIVTLRNAESREMLGRGRRCPDIAFGRDGAPTGSGDRDALVISMRGTRAMPTADWLHGVESFAAARGLRIVVAAQVRSDEQRGAELARALGGEDFGWGDVPDLEQERRLQQLYARARVVVSDRLHVLILASVAGAVPLELVAEPTTKIRTHFACVGIEDVSVDAASLDAAATAATLASATDRDAEQLSEALDVAQHEVAGVRRDVRALIAPAPGGAHDLAAAGGDGGAKGAGGAERAASRA